MNSDSLQSHAKFNHFNYGLGQVWGDLAAVRIFILKRVVSYHRPWRIPDPLKKKRGEQFSMLPQTNFIYI